MKKAQSQHAKKHPPASTPSNGGGVEKILTSPWLLVGLVVLFTVALRIRFLDIPLERDEGEYAYAGQLMLEGIPPYKLAFNMKFPGTYAAYAAIMAVFGQTASGIHIGLLLVNAASILLVYLLGRRWFGTAAGLVSCATYALFSVSPGIYGPQAHATHFVMLAALGGTVLLFEGLDRKRWALLAWSGALYGIAILMKQHGVFFAIFGALYLAWDHYLTRQSPWTSAPRKLISFAGGLAAPVLIAFLWLWAAGVFDRFWFWTFTYAREYVTNIPLGIGMSTFSYGLTEVVGPNLGLWLIAAVGLVLIWLDRHILAVCVTAFLIFSFLTVCPGLYFRPHYFVLMLPAVALLIGAALEVVKRRWNQLTVPMYVACAAAFLFPVFQQQEFFFQMTPEQASRSMYGANPFPESIQIADYIQKHSAKDARIAVLGSEPQIPFYAGRHLASGYMYMHPLMESQPYALTMQREFTRDLEAAAPEYVVWIVIGNSWGATEQSFGEVLAWWKRYQPQRYKVVGIADIGANHTEYRWDNFGTYQPQSTSYVLVFRKRDS